jgi:starch phosphorylase
MKHMQTYRVVPNIPEPLSFLEILSRNLWWCWKATAVELFRRMDPRLWRASGRNPLLFLTLIPPERMEELAADDSFLAHLERVKKRFENGIRIAPQGQQPFAEKEVVAYFSMEFGIHESMPIFAGGLGILAGDHMKASSDLSLPLVGVGLMYRRGYFRQVLDAEGMQQEEYPATDLYLLPVEKARDRSGNGIVVSVAGPDGDIRAMVWQIRVGRLLLFLLDTNLLENPPEMRQITANLYVAEQKTRLCQELVLGIGGMKALAAMGLYPKVCHMNEGHSAFSGLERLALTMSTREIDLETALEIVPRTTVFTTHTPVAAGHDEFPAALVSPALKSFEERLGVSVPEILSWGQPRGASADSPLCMFYLGLRMSRYCNGVSRLHGQVARKMWVHEWPDKPVDEVPITHITNGVHLASWLSPEVSLLFARYLGPLWHRDPQNEKQYRRIDEIYDEELWHAHEMARARLLRVCREHVAGQYRRRNAPRPVQEEAQGLLDPDVLTIGFARRFATYKRAYLLFTDPDRLEAIINSEKHPVQFIFAGKAHPRDGEGKDIIKQIVAFARRPTLRHRMIFLEDYDMHLARVLVQGTDVWLNTPRRPHEACGTSGMKAAINGVLNVSILDGWWAEGYDETVGWAVGEREDSHSDPAFQDALESQALYNVLENEVIPTYYDRKNGNVPGRWIQMMKNTMKMTMEKFSGMRMVREYRDRFYFPAAGRFDELSADGAGRARQLAGQRQRLLAMWDQIKIGFPRAEKEGPFRVGDTFGVTVEVQLGVLKPEEVCVEVYSGRLEAMDQVESSWAAEMVVDKSLGDGKYLYRGTLTCQASGRYGFSARVLPRGDGWQKNIPGLMTWASTS